MPRIKTKKPAQSEDVPEKRKIKKEKVVKDLSPSSTHPIEADSVKEIEDVLIEKEVESPKPKSAKYIEAIGRRKTSVARVRITTEGEKTIFINKLPIEKYFPSPFLRKTLLSPLEIMDYLDKFGIQIVVKGGGFSSQAEAIRHGLARGLELFDPEFRKKLKKAGFLTRDPRMRERKKFGLKRARKAPQWAKR